MHPAPFARLGIPGNPHPSPKEGMKASSAPWGCGHRGERHSPVLLRLLPSRRAQALTGVTGAVMLIQPCEGPVQFPGSIPAGAGQHSALGPWGHPAGTRRGRKASATASRRGRDVEGRAPTCPGCRCPGETSPPGRSPRPGRAGSGSGAGQRTVPGPGAEPASATRGGPICPPPELGDDRGVHVKGQGRCHLPGCSGGGTRRWCRRDRSGCRSWAAPPPPPGR